MKCLLSILLYVACGALISCAKAGLQSTNLPSKFNGLESAVAISPTSVRLSWPLQARFKEYRIYQKGFNTPKKTETFATTTLNSLTPDSYYEFSTSGVDATTDEEFGFDRYMTVKTLANFSGIPSSGLQSQSNGSVEVSWVKNGDGVTYKIFAKRENETWDLTTPVNTVVSKSTSLVNSLPSGAKYCFWVMAFYDDGTFEPTNMSETYLNSKAPCVLVQSQLSNLPAVRMNSAFVGNFPWFWTEGGDSTYKTEIFERFTDIRLATVAGNDYFRSIIPIAPGLKNIYAKVTATDGKVTIVDVQPDGLPGLSKPLVRSLEGSGAKAPLLPRLIGGGLGMQELGNGIQVGDFNCDGYKDVAVSAPRATPYISDRHYDATGAVSIFYGYQPPDEIDSNGNIVRPKPRLKTDVTPTADASFPDPQLIYYTDLTSDARLGIRIAVGNVNGDCFSRYKPPEGVVDNDPKINRVGLCDDLFTPAVPPADLNKLKEIHTCDDLAMQTNDGAVFVVYGDPVRGLVTGAGGSAYGLNEATCDPTSFKCRPSKYRDSTTAYVHSITFGDYNNDGFDDLAMGVTTNANKRQVHVLRGDRFGLYPASATKSHAKIDAESIGAGDLTDGSFLGLSVAEDFAGAVASAYNSRTCTNGGGYIFRTSPAPKNKGFEFNKCDDLVIGVPLRAAGRGSILACKGVQPTAGSDLQQITSWMCKESYPDTSLGISASHITVKGYGYSLLGVPNQNGYPLTKVIGTTNSTPNVSGAVFVGAPTSTVSGKANAGVVFGYYMTPRSADFATGGLQGILAPVQTINAVNSLACDAKNRNVLTGSLEHCENQALHTSPSEAGVQYGRSLGTVADIEDVTRGLPSLAVGVPYRAVTSSDGKKSISNHGVVYLYKPDVSTLGTEAGVRIDAPQLSDDDSYGCATNCTWYSGGVNPFGASIIYAKDMTAGAQIGFGGLAGADFNGDKTGDLIIGAPYLSTPSYFNGAAFVFKSSGTFAASVTTPDQTINVNFSKELNYHYERAKVVGDLNGDGYADVVTHISVASTVELVVFYGSAGGLVTTPEPTRNPVAALHPLKLAVDTDPGFGREFHRIGSVNGDAYDDLLILGTYGSYIYYGSSSGVVYANAPSLAPVGQNPLRFALGGTNTIAFHSVGNMYGSTSTAGLSVGTFNNLNRAVTYGDFNADGYGDFALGTYTDLTPSADVIPGGVNMTAANKGRVFVIYGSATGPQTNRATGTIRLQDDNGAAADVLVENPCGETLPKVCKVQMLASNDTGVTFGWNVVGIDSLDVLAGEETDELIVSDPSLTTLKGRIYLFKGGARGLAYTPIQKLDPAAAAERFGYEVAAAGDINGDGVVDIVVSAPVAGKIYTFYGGQVGSAYAFYGSTSLATTDLFLAGSAPIAKNTLHASQSQPKPQRLEVLGTDAIFEAGDAFGYGLAGIGDVNNDGYADIIVNMPGKDYDLEEVQADSGAFVIYYGSLLGLKINSTPTTTPRCYGGSSPMCEPYLLYLPERKAYEYTYISNSASGDINGDGIPDVVLGAPGRNHPSGKAFSTGVVYVLY
ncbi:hypothetical protein ACNH6C_08105 [Bdellovibrio bacteriovorus]|uniref:hypothetical protein n=1 Tax=Bdellovibrio bacteriovorus TaxID=959 RepID=UPI003A7FBA1D